ncbi:hypothetical protein NLM33_15585 [Bradyrhizobium sp. CCGUVB1N3]|uniref:hypothetical protein n=1 Tax=Bradyrhizobium sp. CCGUVB1N3 TaxID=2949629 RepID=UPI0020B2DAF7|nr:hypothetical protein [Bradyrhizobium sp. CCGUVB1N3]MCP3471741.1 hypothetical protein [Bradyrhizobium sp. CCGUVB1N3]
MSEIEAYTLEGHLSKLTEDSESLSIVFGVQNACTMYPPYTIGRDFIAGHDHVDPAKARPIVAPFNSIQQIICHMRKS